MVSKSELLQRIQSLESTIQQLTETTTEERVIDRDLFRSGYYPGFGRPYPTKIVHTPTIKTEVELIKEHLGIKVEYIPETTKTTEAKIVIKSTKTTKAKAKKASK